MNQWRSYHIYYSKIDSLLLECICPFLCTLQGSLGMFFWERHYAGGPHVRVRFQGDGDSLDRIDAAFVPLVQHYLEKFPSRPLEKYSPERAAQLLEMEQEPFEPSELEYRVNTICQWPYRRLQSSFVKGAGLELMHEFLRDSNPVAEALLREPERKRDNLLRFYFLVALFPDGAIVPGSVSFKSHWEGFAATFKSRAVLERIRGGFEDQRDTIVATMENVTESYKRQDFSGDPLLADWLALLRRYGDKAGAMLRHGEQINYTMTPDEARHYHLTLQANQVEPSEFVDSLFEDPAFLQAYRSDLELAWPRVLVNFLYLLIPAVGLTMIDRMALCYYSHKAVETHFQCNLTDILRSNIADALNR